MYWDVVEVKPQPGHSLYVRFKDGLAGRVRLCREELTGALAWHSPPSWTSSFLRRSLLIAVQLRGLVKSIWRRMQSTLRLPVAVTGCRQRGSLTGGQMNQCRDDTPKSALGPPLFASATKC